MKPHWLLFLLFGTALLFECTLHARSHRILFVAGAPSHGPGEHEFPAGCALLADALNQCGLGIEAEVSNGWPRGSTDYDSIVVYGDGLDDHVLEGHLAAVDTHIASGGGVAIIHFALEPNPGALADWLLRNVGGRFETDWSVNPVWKMTHPILREHPISNGVGPFHLRDELYFHLRLRQDITPILQATPPLESLGDDGPRSGNPAVRAELEAKIPQTLAWTYEGAGVRTFGYTGGHYHYHWAQDDLRTLILNAIAWTAGVEIPAEGISSTASPIPHYITIEEAIARGDLEDVKAHVAAFPKRLHEGKHPKLSPLQQAILRKQSTIALYLLEAGAKANQVDTSRRTLVHLAVDRGTPALVTALLKHGAEPDHLDKVGWTPLHHAAAGNKIEIADALLVGGADPTTLSERGGTALHEAAASGSADMIHRILDQGVDPTIVSKTGATALDIAREFQNEEAIETLTAAMPTP